jgi:predicted nucleic acid-binding protein
VRWSFVVRQSSVVLSELRRGAHTREAQAIVDALRRQAPVEWAPTIDDWWEAAALVRDIGAARKWDAGRRGAFQNDALIALTARRHGAVVVTANRVDFEPLAGALSTKMFFV